MFLVLLERDLFVQLVEIAINPNSAEAGLSGFRKDVLKLAFSTAHDRRHDSDSTALRHLENPVGDLLGCLARDLVAADRAVRMADPGVHQAQIVIDLGDRADGRTRVVARPLLIDRDGG